MKYLTREYLKSRLEARRVNQPKKFVIVVNESYTPRDFLHQRYVVKLRRNGKSGTVLMTSEPTCNPESIVNQWRSGFGVKLEDVHFDIP